MSLISILKSIEKIKMKYIIIGDHLILEGGREVCVEDIIDDEMFVSDIGVLSIELVIEIL